MGRKAFRHRLDCHAPDGRFLGGAEFKTGERRSERTTKKELLTRLRAQVRLPAEYTPTFTLNESVVL
jgi:hypothetical protein